MELSEKGEVQALNRGLEERCLNCHTPLSGTYCSECGQNSTTSRLVTLGTWFRELAGSFLSVDSKFLRTLRRVVFQPGQATLDFAEGRRVAYTGPAKLYVLVSAISIAAMTLWGVFSPAAFEAAQVQVDSGFSQRMQFLFPIVNLFSPMLTALVLIVFDQENYAQIHIAYSLHIWTFVVAVGTLLIFIPPASLWALLGLLVMCSLTVFYVYKSNHRVYRRAFFHQQLVLLATLGSILFAMAAFPVLLFLVAFYTG